MRISRSKLWIGLGVIIALLAAAWTWLRYSEREREITGVWIYAFEDSNFFEGATPDNIRTLYLDEDAQAGWLTHPHPSRIQKRYESDQAADCPMVEQRVFELRFIGRRIGGRSGHLGAWNSRYEIEKVLEIEQIPWPYCDIPEEYLSL